MFLEAGKKWLTMTNTLAYYTKGLYSWCWERFAKWKGINCKQSTRWQHLSRLKASAFFSLRKNFSCYKTQQLILGIGIAIWWLTEPHLMVKPNITSIKIQIPKVRVCTIKHSGFVIYRTLIDFVVSYSTCLEKDKSSW